MKKIINVDGKSLHLVLGKTIEEYKSECGQSDDMWDFPIEELLDGTIEINENMWYWLIGGRCYEAELMF